MDDFVMEKLSFCSLAWNLLGLGFCLADVVLDVHVVLGFYQEEAYACMGVLIFLLLLSSVLLNMFSYLWYSYRPMEQQEETSIFPYINRYLKNQCLIKTLHVLQLGIYLRYAAVLEISVRNRKTTKPLEGNIVKHLNNDLSILKVIEAFTENAPQLTLMMCVILLRGDLEIVKCLKTAAALSAIAFSVLMYHRSLCSSLPNESKEDWRSSLVYFLWNLLLIGPRLGALALFASVEPYYTAAHFLVLWPVLVLWAWRQDTDFMDSQCGEWLYRATVGVIWYFSWFDASPTRGSTRNKRIIYHSLMSVDTAVLLTVWFIWKEEPFRLGPVSAPLLIVITSLYILGIIVRIVYYKKLHVELRTKDQILSVGSSAPSEPEESQFSLHAASDNDIEELKGHQKRMKRMVDNFFS